MTKGSFSNPPKVGKSNPTSIFGSANNGCKITSYRATLSHETKKKKRLTTHNSSQPSVNKSTTHNYDTTLVQTLGCVIASRRPPGAQKSTVLPRTEEKMAQALTQLGRLGGVVAVGAYILPHIIYDGNCSKHFPTYASNVYVLDLNRTLGVKESRCCACLFAFQWMAVNGR